MTDDELLAVIMIARKAIRPDNADGLVAFEALADEVRRLRAEVERARRECPVCEGPRHECPLED